MEEALNNDLFVELSDRVKIISNVANESIEVVTEVPNPYKITQVNTVVEQPSPKKKNYYGSKELEKRMEVQMSIVR